MPTRHATNCRSAALQTNDVRTAASLLLAAAAVLAACSSESYDTGDGKYSYLTADFGEVRTDAACRIAGFQTDGGQTLTVGGDVRPSWATTPDSVYRALVYYDRRGADDAAASAVRVVSVAQVPVLKATDASHFGTPHTDPVRFESVWMAASGKYINLGLSIMTGRTADGAKGHTVGMMLTSVSTSPDGRSTAHLTLYHDQGDVPQNYSSRQYVSVPTASVAADSVCLTVHTYSGVVTRRMAVSGRKRPHG